MFPNHPFRQAENGAIELEEILHRVVILEAVQATDGSGGCDPPGGQSLGSQGLQVREEFPASGLGERWFVLRWHFFEVDSLYEVLEEVGVFFQVAPLRELEQVDFSLDLAVLAVALDAAFPKDFDYLITQAERSHPEQ